MAIESEIKYTVAGPDVFAGIAALREIASYDAADHGMHRHRDTYFDTADCLLLRSKVVFRLRERKAGSMLTFKAQAPGGGSFYRRIEVESAADVTAADIEAGRLPDLPPVEELRRRTAAPLVPSLSVDNRRHIVTLAHGGVPRFELALDDVTFTGPRGTARVYELEVESLGWGDEELGAIGSWLAARFDLAPAGPSKYILGMDLVGKTNTIG